MRPAASLKRRHEQSVRAVDASAQGRAGGPARAGTAPDLDALVGYEFRGFNVGRNPALLGVQKFIKGFFRGRAPSRVTTCASSKTGLQGPGCPSQLLRRPSASASFWSRWLVWARAHPITAIPARPCSIMARARATRAGGRSEYYGTTSSYRTQHSRTFCSARPSLRSAGRGSPWASSSSSECAQQPGSRERDTDQADLAGQEPHPY
jgi:hypothetical protein